MGSIRSDAPQTALRRRIVGVPLLGDASPARDETLVEGCWVNPGTGRLEPPAPWDDAYRAARAAGRTRAAPRHAVGERN